MPRTLLTNGIDVSPKKTFFSTCALTCVSTTGYVFIGETLGSVGAPSKVYFAGLGHAFQVSKISDMGRCEGRGAWKGEFGIDGGWSRPLPPVSPSRCPPFKG